MMGLMGGSARFEGRRAVWVPLALCLFVGSCSLLPSEFNLSPIYRHRLDENGDVLEMDVLWPLIHYETLANGG